MTDMRVMLDLDSETLREMLAQRIHTLHRCIGECDTATDWALEALRSLAADGLLVRG